MSEEPLAAIDIGSNSGRMIVVRMTGQGHLEVLADARAVLRLMRDVGAEGALSDDALSNTVDALRGFLGIAHTAGATRVLAVATAAVREASNRDDFIRQLRTLTGVSVAILEGDDEARLAFLGAVHGLPVESGLLLDIGGGSVEIAEFRERRQTGSWTLPLGALRLSDRFFPEDPPRPVEIDALRDYVRSMLVGAGVPTLRAGDQVVGTGGTIRTAAKIHRAGRSYPIPRLHGYVIRRSEVAEVARRVCARSLPRRRAISGLSTDRAESIPGGALVIATALEHIGAREMVVSGQGLREGLVFQDLRAGLPEPLEVRRAGVIALASRFRTWDAEAAKARARLAGALGEAVDGDAPQEMREALEHAAVLIDVGRSIDYFGRWQHACTVLLASDLTGFSHRGIACIATVIDQAGSDRPPSRRLGALITRDDRKSAERAGILLRLADELIRRFTDGSNARIETRDRRGAVIIVLPTSNRWQPGELGRRFRRVFGRPFAIECESSPPSAGGLALDLK